MLNWRIVSILYHLYITDKHIRFSPLPANASRGYTIIWLNFNFFFIILHLPKTQEEEYKVYSIFPHSWSRCLMPCKTISAHCLWFRFIASLILLHTQRNPQHFLNCQSAGNTYWHKAQGSFCEYLPLSYYCSKTYPSFLTVKEVIFSNPSVSL